MPERIAVAITKNASGSVPTSYKIERSVDDGAWTEIESSYSTGISNGNLTYKDSGQNDGNGVDGGLPDAKYEYRAYGITVDGTGAVSVSSTPADITISDAKYYLKGDGTTHQVWGTYNGAETFNTAGDFIEMKFSIASFDNGNPLWTNAVNHTSTNYYITQTVTKIQMNFKGESADLLAVSGLPTFNINTMRTVKIVYKTATTFDLYIDGVLEVENQVHDTDLILDADEIMHFSMLVNENDWFNGKIEYVQWNNQKFEFTDINATVVNSNTGDSGETLTLHAESGNLSDMFELIS